MQIIKQDNGLFCLYDTVEDIIVSYNLTKNDVREYFMKEAALKAKHNVNKIFDKIANGIEPYYQFTIKWDEVKHLTSNSAVLFYGTEIDFNVEATMKTYKQVAKDILNNLESYGIPDTDDSYYTHIKYIWIKLPSGQEERLADYLI